MSFCGVTGGTFREGLFKSLNLLEFSASRLLGEEALLHADGCQFGKSVNLHSPAPIPTVLTLARHGAQASSRRRRSNASPIAAPKALVDAVAASPAANVTVTSPAADLLKTPAFAPATSTSILLSF